MNCYIFEAMKKKFYVVWKGRHPGIYDNWDACLAEVDGFPGAQYKSFPDAASARQAFNEGIVEMGTGKTKILPDNHQQIILPSISVDAACSGNPGPVEYRGVDTQTGKEIFRRGPYADGSNNMGEFLAIVHALALLKKNNSKMPVYTDSATALAWVRDKKIKTKITPTATNKPLFELLERALQWLNQNTWENPLLKWNTEEWGEIPADFGRK